jgi:amino acid adenylation domain-containing protein
MSSLEVQGERAYWRRRLAGSPPLLALATDRPRPAAPSPQRGSLQVPLSAELHAQVHAMARHADTTPYVTLLAAFAALLRHYTGQVDLPVGGGVASRGRAAEGFVNMVVIRTDVSGDPTFRELLARVGAISREAFEHQALPFEDVVEALQPERNPGFHAVFQVAFSALGTALPTTESPRRGSAPLDLHVIVIPAVDERRHESGEGLTLVWEYSTDLFDAATVVQMAAHYAHLLEQCVAHPARRVSALSPVGAEEHHRLLVDHNATHEPLAHGLLIHEWVAALAAHTPEAWAASSAGQQLSYRALDEQANRLAHHLRALGVGPEIAVGVCLERTPMLLVALLAVLKAGGAYVPMEPGFPAERQHRMLEDARAPWVLTQQALAGKLASGPARPVVLDTLPLDALPAGPPVTHVAPHNLAYILFTSGSTGRPKGIGVEHRTLMSCVHWTLQAMRLQPGQNTSHLAGQSFDASVLEIWTGLTAGACVHLPPEAIRASAIELQAWMIGNAIHAAFLATPLGEAMLALDWPRPGHLHTLLVGGARLHAPPSAQIPFTLVNIYGPTETTVAVTTAVIAPGDAGGRPPPIGKPLPNTRLYVLDARMALVGLGMPGELYVGGDCVTRGYASMPAMTAERYVPSPFGPAPGERLYRTGDIVRWGTDGQLEFLGRRDGQVKLRGFRIELEEISTVLAQHPQVRQAFARFVPRAAGDGSILGYVVPRDGGLDPDALKAFLAEHVPDYMVPAQIVLLDAFPLTSSGKVDAAALPLPAPRAVGTATEPRSPLERELAALWSELLEVEHLGPEDDVRLLGAHSLLMAQAQARIRERLQVEVPLAHLFEASTVAAQARIVETAPPRTTARPLPLTRASRTRPLPLSFAQEQVWLLQELHPTSRSYNSQALLRIRGELDEGVLASCLDEIVRRHEVLRTTFRTPTGQPLQTIHPPFPVSVPRVDLRALPAAERAEALKTLQQAELARTFDVGELPLMRVLLVRMAEREWTLLHVEHHFVHDGWSYSVFLFELLSLYRELAAGRPSPLPELPVQYADFTAWQRQWIDTEDANRQRAYWRTRLAGSPPLLALATDRPRPPAPSMRGASLRVPLSAALHDQVRAVARQEGATVYATLLAAFTALLQRYTGQDDLPVGSGVANRRWRETEGLLGMFVNMVVLRTDLSGDPTFREVLARVGATTLEAFEHQDLPFQHVVEALQPERNLGFNALFQVAFNFHDTPLAAMDPPGLSVELQEGLSNGSSKFDLNIIVIPHVGQRRRESGEGLTLVWEYSTDLFDAATVAQMAAHYAHLLEQCLAHPERRISALSPVGAEEHHRLLVDHNATHEPLAHGLLIHEWVAAQAARTPEAWAASGAGQQLSYRALDEQANRLAHHLRALGVGPEIAVGVCLERTPMLLVALLAVLKAGGAYVPMEPGFPAERQHRMLEDARAPWVLTQQALAGKLASGPARPVVLDTLPLDALPAEPPVSGVAPENLAYILFTSGSTGRPKGIGVEHRTLMNCVHWTLQAMRLQPGQNTSHLAGQSFDASVLEIWTGLAAGACVHLPPEAIRASAIELQEWMIGQAIHAGFLATPLGEAMLALDWPRPGALHTLLVGGARLHAPPSAQIPFTLVNIYGPTETTVAVTTAVIAPGDAGGRPPPIGKPLPNTRLYVLDARMALVGLGMPGELYVGGDCVTRGYASMPAMTAERYVPSPFGPAHGERLYRTGDIVRWGTDGQLEFLGRRDGQVKLRGFRIELEEISTVLAHHPQVRQAFARFVPRAAGDGSILGYVVPRDGGLAPEALKDFLAEHVPDYMVPAQIVVLDAFPLTSSGKVDAAALPLPAPPAAGTSQEPRSPLERELAALWSELLGGPAPGVDDDFFALGGSSLMASQLVTRLRTAFAVPIALRAVFEHARLADLAEHLAELQLSHADAATLRRLLEEVEQAPPEAPR